jgi:hypothetical protein
MAMSPKRPRVWLLVVSLTALPVIVFVALRSRDHSWVAGYDRIRPEMTETELEEILGKPDDCIGVVDAIGADNDDRFLYWVVPGGYIVVEVGEGKVISKHIENRQETRWQERIRRYLGL